MLTHTSHELSAVDRNALRLAPFSHFGVPDMPSWRPPRPSDRARRCYAGRLAALTAKPGEISGLGEV